MITFQAEGWDRYFADPALWGLWSLHYAEFRPFHQDRMLFGPDIATYKAMADMGMLEVIVARKNGVMIGYCLFTVKRHLHYDALCAFEDSYFVVPEERGNGAGRGLIEKAREVAKARGVRACYWMTKEFKSIAFLFERLGMERSDSVFVDWMEG